MNDYNSGRAVSAPQSPRDAAIEALANRKQKQKMLFIVALVSASSAAIIGLLVVAFVSRSRNTAATRSGTQRESRFDERGSLSLPAAGSRPSKVATVGKRGVANPAVAPGTSGGASLAVAAQNVRWVNAESESVEHNGLRIRVKSASLEQPQMVPASGNSLEGRTIRTRTRCLLVRLQIENTRPAESVKYTSWSALTGGAGPAMADNFDRGWSPKTYRNQGFVPQGQLTKTTVGPSAAVDDVLMFAPQPEGWKTLRLVLPGVAVGEGEVAFGFEIPATMVSETAGPILAEFAPTPGAPREREKPTGIDKISRDIEALGGGDQKPVEPGFSFEDVPEAHQSFETPQSGAEQE